MLGKAYNVGHATQRPDRVRKWKAAVEVSLVRHQRCIEALCDLPMMFLEIDQKFWFKVSVVAVRPPGSCGRGLQVPLCRLLGRTYGSPCTRRLEWGDVVDILTAMAFHVVYMGGCWWIGEVKHGGAANNDGASTSDGQEPSVDQVEAVTRVSQLQECKEYENRCQVME